LKNDGVKGMFKGYWPTFFRDVPGWAVFFYAYELFKKLVLTEPDPEKREKMGRNFWEFFKRFMAAGVAGICSWSVGFPFDVIKTNMMLSKEPLTMKQII
jgi:solute carrier family 25 carnitine/acylcarnitine transporter 20/29